MSNSQFGQQSRRGFAAGAFALALGTPPAWPALAAAPDPALVESSKASSPPTSSDTALTIGEITVRGRRRGHPHSKDVAASVTIVGQDQIKNESVTEPLGLLRRVPGIWVADFNQGLISGDVGVRGFNTSGEVAPLKLLIDGIPSNIHIGLADMKPIFPLEIDRIELVRGTNDARHGLYAVAGNLQIFTRQGGNHNVVRGTTGSFNTYEAQAASGFENEHFTQNLFGAFRYSESYREHAQAQKYALSGKWFYKLGEGFRAGVMARMFRLEAEAPGYLTELEAAATPKAAPTFSNEDGGTQSNRHGSVHFDWDVSNNVFWSLKGYYQTVKRKRLVRFTAASTQQERFEWEKQSGALTQLTYRPGGFGVLEDLVLSSGADLQYQDNVFRRFVTDNSGNRVAPNRDQAFDLFNYGAFLQADVRPTKWLRLTGGVRWDKLDGDLKNQLKGGESTPMLAFGSIWQPKLSVVVTPVEGYNVYGNFGRSFQVPVRDGLYGTQSLTYSKNNGWEGGLKLQPIAWLTGRVAYWRQTATDEVRLKFNSASDAENVGSTLRHGLDVEAGVRPFDSNAVYLWSSYTYQRTKLVEPGANLVDLKGQELSHQPRHLLKAGLEVRPIRPVLAAATVLAQGDYGLRDSTNLKAVAPDTRVGGYTLVNLDVSYTWRTLTFGGHVKNLLDSRWQGHVWNDGTVTLMNPGDARAFLASVETSF
jgi:iron complex outermembrane recepter protein